MEEDVGEGWRSSLILTPRALPLMRLPSTLHLYTPSLTHSRMQFAFARVSDKITKLQKFVLVNWVSTGLVLLLLTSHAARPCLTTCRLRIDGGRGSCTEEQHYGAAWRQRGGSLA